MATNMADQGEAQKPHEFSELDMRKAKKWFEKAEQEREKRSYDYAIESYIRGLEFWPEAVEEGHKPLRSLSIQRSQAGGKKPGMMESMKLSMGGKDYKKAMLNAERLLAKDPNSASYLDGLLKNAAKGAYFETLLWITPLVMDSLQKDSKPNLGRFKTFRETMRIASELAQEMGQVAPATEFLTSAVNSLDFLMMRKAGDDRLRDEQRDLSGRLTILKGKYQDSESFHESIQDAEGQKRLHDAERSKQDESTLQAVIDAARKELAEDPDDAKRIGALVEVLTKSEQKPYEDEAREVLLGAYKRSKNYNFKSRSDDIAMRQMRRLLRQLDARAKKNNKPEDIDKLKTGRTKVLANELKIYRERVSQYPTDLRLKYRLGTVLFEVGNYDEAIPVLQEAQGDPKTRSKCQLMIGRSFYQNDSPGEAAEVLRDAYESLEVKTDDTAREMLYWLGQALAVAGQTEEAINFLGRLVRMDYNFAGGAARKKLDELKNKGAA
jgi:tetratricopeptide (TPR) repeat protein